MKRVSSQNRSNGSYSVYPRKLKITEKRALNYWKQSMLLLGQCFKKRNTRKKEPFKLREATLIKKENKTTGYNAELIHFSSIILLAQIIQIHSFTSENKNKAHVLIKNQPESIMINKATNNSRKLQTQHLNPHNHKTQLYKSAHTWSSHKPGFESIHQPFTHTTTWWLTKDVQLHKHHFEL